MRLSTIVLLLVISGGLLAQAPVVLTVSSPYNHDARFSPGGFVRVNGANLTVGVPPTVTVGGIKAAYVGSDPEDSYNLDVVLPPNLSPGPATLVVTTAAGSSTPYPLTIKRYSLEFSYPWFQRQVAFGGQAAAPVHDCFVGEDTAAAGETLTAYAVGLGAPGMEDPRLSVGGQEAHVLDYESVSGQPGVYSVTFRVPQVEGVLPVIFTADGENSPPLLLPVGAVKGWSTLGLRRAAPGALVSTQSCGPNLEPIGTSFQSEPSHPQAALGGVTVTIKDAGGVERAAPLLAVDCCSLSFQVPAETAPGLATVKATNKWGSLAGYLDVRPLAPVFPLFEGGVNGEVEGSAYVLRVRNGVQSVERAAALLPIGQYGFRIDMGPATDDVYLVLLGTGVRNRSSLKNVTALIDDTEVPVLYAGPQAELAGLDQINVKLPRTLAGRGTAHLQFAFDGVPNQSGIGSMIYLDIH